MVCGTGGGAWRCTPAPSQLGCTMGYCQLFVNGLIHIAMLPLLILSWLVLTVTRYSRFTGARLPWATLPSVVGGFCSEE